MCVAVLLFMLAAVIVPLAISYIVVWAVCAVFHLAFSLVAVLALWLIFIFIKLW